MISKDFKISHKNVKVFTNFTKISKDVKRSHKKVHCRCYMSYTHSACLYLELYVNLSNISTTLWRNLEAMMMVVEKKALDLSLSHRTNCHHLRSLSLRIASAVKTKYTQCVSFFVTERI